MTLQCPEAGANGSLPGCTAVDRRQEIDARHRRLKSGVVIAVDHRLDG